MRFSKENAAADAAKKINDSLKEGEKLKIKEDEIEVKALEGQEEKDFLAKIKKDQKRALKAIRNDREHEERVRQLREECTSLKEECRALTE